VPVFSWDTTRLPLAAGSVDVICSDLPFGHDVGSHDENLILYPRMLKEAARIAAPGARVVLLSHELRLMESILSRSGEWEVAEKISLTINGLHPHLYSLIKRAS
jgi:tRNA (guanine6-N2)-methyltransferase